MPPFFPDVSKKKSFATLHNKPDKPLNAETVSEQSRSMYWPAGGREAGGKIVIQRAVGALVKHWQISFYFQSIQMFA